MLGVGFRTQRRGGAVMFCLCPIPPGLSLSVGVWVGIAIGIATTQESEFRMVCEGEKNRRCARCPGELSFLLFYG